MQRLTDIQKSLLFRNRKLNRRAISRKSISLCLQLKKTEEHQQKQFLCQSLINSLNKHFSLPKCKITLYNKNRPIYCRKLGEGKGGYFFGRYCAERGKTSYIEMWSFTTKGRRVSSSSLLHTLIHEFIHHYDNKKLNIDIDHDAGFKARIRFLTNLVKKANNLL